MSTIIDTIKTICEDNLQLPFLYESVGMGNVRLDKQREFPLALLLSVTDWEVDNTIGNLKETADIRLFFLTKSGNKPSIDYDATTNQTMIDTCKGYALNFIDRVNKSNVIDFNSNSISIKSVYDYDDANVTGVVIMARIKERAGECLPIMG